MRILVADDDALYRRFLEKTLGRRTSHALTVVSDGQAALSAALADPPPDVLILDWLMPGLNGTQVCRELRARNSQQYVIMVTGRSRREEVLSCLEAGADDVLIKPVAPDLLVAKVERAQQRLDSSKGLRDALADAARDGDGELVVVCAESITLRVFFHEHAVAWLDAGSGSPSFLQALVASGAVDREGVRGVVEECRRTGESVTDVIVAWGLMSAPQLRDRLRGWMRDTLAFALGFPPPRTLFLPQRRRYSGALLFPLADVMPSVSQVAPAMPSPERKPSLIPANRWEQAFALESDEDGAVDAMLDRCMRGDGVLGVAAFGRVSGICLGRRGRDVDPDAAWAQIQMLNTLIRLEPVEDSVVATEQHYHLVRRVQSEPEAFLYAVVDAHTVKLALARMEFREAASRLDATG